MTAHRRVEDAAETAESLRRELVLKLEAGSGLTQDEVDSYNRALDTWTQAKVLWEDHDGLLEPDHDTVRAWTS